MTSDNRKSKQSKRIVNSFGSIGYPAMRLIIKKEDVDSIGSLLLAVTLRLNKHHKLPFDKIPLSKQSQLAFMFTMASRKKHQ